MPVLPLFYSRAIAVSELRQYALGLFEPPAVDVIEFTEPDGGVVTRELAIPFLQGMDAVVVEQAQLELRSRSREMDADFETREAGGGGVFVVLPRVARLLKVGLDFASPPAVPGQTVRLVVRSAQKQGTSFTPGPPLYAHPVFEPPGPMFPRPLGGMSVTQTSTGAVLTLPRPLGDSWLIQLATGDDAVKLAPLAVTPVVRFVRIDAVTRDLAVTLHLGDEAPQVWGHPDLFLPDFGVQEMDFSPLAQKRLSDSLAKADPRTTVTLPVVLEFRSGSGGDIAVASRTLNARYTVDALGADGTTVELAGDFTPVTIEAPAALRPAHAEADLTIRPLGRALNAGCDEPSTAVPSRGLRLRSDSMAAGAARFDAPQPSQLAASPLVSVRVYLSSATASEAVAELRADAAGVPGVSMASPMVRQLQAGFTGWVEFELASPWVPPEATAVVWVSLRANQGELFWFTVPDDVSSSLSARVSLDRGLSWGAPTESLAASLPLTLQLFNAVPDPQPEPVVRLQHGPSLLADNLLRVSGNVPVRQGPREFMLSAAALPASLALLLAEQPGAGKVHTRLVLFSRAVVELQVTRCLLEYDPFEGAATPA